MFRSLLYIALLISPLFAGQSDTVVLPITPDIAQRMIDGGSFHEECPVPLSKLRYLHIRYRDLENRTQTGELIVHESVADEVVQLFTQLYRTGFRIARIQLVSAYGANDEASMRANNTSAFNCRYIAGTKKFSRHSYGKAIDINPLLNPCVQKGEVSPANAGAYLDRKQNLPGMIHRNGTVVRLFKKYGWKWGGDWHSLKDYQHFEK